MQGICRAVKQAYASIEQDNQFHTRENVRGLYTEINIMHWKKMPSSHSNNTRESTEHNFKIPMLSFNLQKLVHTTDSCE